MLAVNEIGEPLLFRSRLAAKPAVPAGCKGAACPFFAQCQGRCGSEARTAPDGGVLIETRG